MSIPPVKDRETIDEEIKFEIKKQNDPTQKMQLLALNYYLQLKKQKDKELEIEMEKLAQKYQQEALEYQTKIQNIVEGKADIEKEELQGIDKYLEESEKQDMKKFDQYIENKEPIPAYWYKCLKDCPMIMDEITEQDANVLNDLTKIEYQPDHNSKNFSLIFYFGENDYFKNPELLKTFYMEAEDQPYKAEGTHIDWKEGKDVTKKTIKQNQKNKKTGAKRQIAKEVDDKSFFNFFKTINLREQTGFEKMSEEARGQLEEKMNIDYDIARAIIDEVLPYSLEYYLNVRGKGNLDLLAQQNEEEDEEDYQAVKKKKQEDKKEEIIQDKPECQQQ